MSTAGFHWRSRWPVIEGMDAISPTAFWKMLLSTQTYFDLKLTKIISFFFLKLFVPGDANENSSGKCLGDLPHPLLGS